jgi:transglutaminase-like putative cysteine protease
VEQAGAPVTPRPALRVVEPVVAVLVTALGAVSFAPFYAAWWWLVLPAAVALGGLCSGVAAARRWPWWAAVPAQVVLLALLVIELGYREYTADGVPTPGAAVALGRGLVTGLPKMLTVGLPADPAGDLLVVPLVLAWLAGAVAVTVALRTAAVTALAAPPLGLFVVGLLLTASRPQPRLLATGAVVLAVLVLLLLRSNRIGAASDEGIAEADAAAVGVDLAARRRHSVLGRVAFGLPAVAVATVLAVAATWLLPVDGSTRLDPRALRIETVQLTDTLSPLAQLRPQLTGPSAPLFTVTVSSPDGSDYRPDRVRTAALDVYDGALWTGSREFAVTGSTLPGFEPLDGKPVDIRLDVAVDPAVDPATRPFLPLVGEPVQLVGAGFAFDRATSTAVRTSPTAGPFTYSTVGEIRPQDESIRQAKISDEPGDRAFTELPARPPWVTELADLATASREDATAMAQLLAMEEFLRRQPYSQAAAPGHSYGALKRALLGAPGERIGSAEQYSATFALLARAKGYPARVAVGYRLRPEARDGDVYRVSTTDAHAWPEVHLAGFGWVPFEPTDASTSGVPPPPRAPEVTLGAADLDRPAVAPQRDIVEQPTLAQVALNIARWLAIAVGVLVALALLVAVAKALRRARRARHGPPVRRVLAAWAELLDLLRETGLPVPVSRTSTEVAGDVRHSPAAVAARSVEALAPLATAAVYAPEEPTDADAVRAWELVTRIRRETAAVLGFGARLRALVDPRPLLPRARRARRQRRQPAARSAAHAGTGRSS